MADHPQRRASDQRPRLTALGAAVGLAFLVIAVIAGFSIVGPEGKTTPLATMLVGFASPAFLALLTLAKTERVGQNVDALRQEVRDQANGNGHDTTGGG